MGFAPGRVILHRNVRRGRIGWVRPARVVSDDERGLLLWVARGTPVANEAFHDGRFMRQLPFEEWVLGPHRLVVGDWNGPGVLKLIPPGAAHSVWWFRDEAGRFSGWYVNLEEPAVRWEDDGGLAGVDMIDQDLDIVVRPDRSWEWKDEDEFVERLRHPEHYWVTDEAAVRAEGERVVKQIEAGEFPFDGAWTGFRPDPHWTIPELPPGWDRPPVIR
jgi:predicted RNA-binding protein associated with RNAse of E/G family